MRAKYLVKGPDVFKFTLHPVSLLAYCNALNMYVAAKNLKFYTMNLSHSFRSSSTEDRYDLSFPSGPNLGV